jgi:uncharacterized protein (DUF2384 family)
MSPQMPQLARDSDETADIQKLIDEVVPDAETWKQTPNPLLGGQRPIDLLHSPQEQVLRDMLRAAKHGMAS